MNSVWITATMFVVFLVGCGFGALVTLIFAPSHDCGAAAHEREHNYWHHPGKD